ncbi:MAG: hypothetical protein HYV26_22610 [Candidatus Hydrogenedentes bacterium]|nr:hypothetical protein [Candidatus Hydrogenedentota bacterium]
MDHTYPLHVSHETVAGVPVGSHVVGSSNLADWVKPQDVTITVVANETVEIALDYVRPSTEAEACPEGSLFSQRPNLFGESPQFESSQCSSGARVTEHFAGELLTIGRIRWWGHLDTCPACDYLRSPFEVTFYAEEGGLPGPIVAGPYPVTALVEKTKYEVGSRVRLFESELPEAVALERGWISIASCAQPEAQFEWLTSLEGDKKSAIDLGTGFQASTLDYSLCLLPVIAGEGEGEGKPGLTECPEGTMFGQPPAIRTGTPGVFYDPACADCEALEYFQDVTEPVRTITWWGLEPAENTNGAQVSTFTLKIDDLLSRLIDSYPGDNLTVIPERTPTGEFIEYEADSGSSRSLLPVYRYQIGMIRPKTFSSGRGYIGIHAPGFVWLYADNGLDGLHFAFPAWESPDSLVERDLSFCLSANLGSSGEGEGEGEVRQFSAYYVMPEGIDIYSQTEDGSEDVRVLVVGDFDVPYDPGSLRVCLASIGMLDPVLASQNLPDVVSANRIEFTLNVYHGLCRNSGLFVAAAHDGSWVLSNVLDFGACLYTYEPPRSIFKDDVIDPTADTTIYEGTECAGSNGVGSQLFAGTYGRARRRAFLDFSTDHLVELTLRLCRTSQPAPGVEPPKLYLLHQEWGEGDSIAPDTEAGRTGAVGGRPTAGDATWDYAFYGDVYWAEPGARLWGLDYWPSVDPIVDPYSPYIYCRFSLPVNMRYLRSCFHGFALVADESSENTIQAFGSREHPDPEKRPLVYGWEQNYIGGEGEGEDLPCPTDDEPGTGPGDGV